jgi:hypothetical protein
VTFCNEPGVIQETLNFAAKTAECAGNVTVFFQKAQCYIEVVTDTAGINIQRSQTAFKIRIERQVRLIRQSVCCVKKGKAGELSAHIQRLPEVTDDYRVS